MTDFVAAEAGIRQLHARFVDAVWRQDADAFAECFAQDGEWKIAGMHMKGREEIGSTFGKLLGACERVATTPGLPILEVDGKTARGRLPLSELAKMVDGTTALTLGVYHDEYVEEGGRWLFQWRHFALKYRGPTDFSADIVPTPDYGPFPGRPDPDEPTLTRRKVD